MNDFTKVLSRDPVMKGLIEKYGVLPLAGSVEYFDDLIGAVIGQLLSAKAADTIYKRIAALCGGGEVQSARIIKSTAYVQGNAGSISPENLLAVSDEALRVAGSSYGKIRCMKALAQAVISGAVDLKNIERCGNDKVIAQLTAIKGIGRWTAEMFLIFSLAREDVFSHGDGGLNSAVNRLYGGGTVLSKAEVTAISDRWQPFRSRASLYLWRTLDGK